MENHLDIMILIFLMSESMSFGVTYIFPAPFLLCSSSSQASLLPSMSISILHVLSSVFETYYIPCKKSMAFRLSGFSRRQREIREVNPVFMRISQCLNRLVFLCRSDILSQATFHYFSRVGIFWTENSVWYSCDREFCRFGMRSIRSIRFLFLCAFRFL